MWLVEDALISGYEVPEIVKNGCEVFVANNARGQKVRFDSTLSIPNVDLKRLYSIDFSKSMTSGTAELINKYFDIVFFDYVPELLRWITKVFHGVLVLCAAGLSDGRTYTDAILEDLGVATFQRMKKLGSRFFFAQAYPSLLEDLDEEKLKNSECDFFRQQALDLPVRALERRTSRERKHGSKIVIYLPEISAESDRTELHQKINKVFSDLDHVIIGEQTVEVPNDPTVTGELETEEENRLFESAAALFYPEQKRNCVPESVHRAIEYDLPVVTLGDGLLNSLIEDNPKGNCGSLEEAHKTLSKIAKGHKYPSSQILNAQHKYLEDHSHVKCSEVTKKSLKRIVEQSRQPYVARKRKIAVIMTRHYLGGVLDYTIRLIKAILMGVKEYGDDISVVLGYPENEVYRDKDYFRKVKELGVSLRPYQWKEKMYDWTGRTYELMNVPNPPLENRCVMDDGMHFFEDCDFIIFTSHQVPGRVFTTRPYITVVHDCIQRYIPSMFYPMNELFYLDLIRGSDCVFTTTSPTMEDVIQFVGISPRKVRLTPLMFDLILPSEPSGSTEPIIKKDYFLWSTNVTPHKNHKKALLGLAEYYHEGGTLMCVVTGVNTDLFDIRVKEKRLIEKGVPADSLQYIKEVRSLIENDRVLYTHIKIMGNMPKEEYLRVLKEAKFIFHPGYGDNGNGTAIDAACLGVPTVCSDYPAMRYIDTYCGLNAHYFDPFDEYSIKDALSEAERNSESYKKMVPTLGGLKRITVESSYKELYRIIRDVIGV